MAVAGGGQVIQQFVKAGLLDELQIHLVPVLLGGRGAAVRGHGPGDDRVRDHPGPRLHGSHPPHAAPSEMTAQAHRPRRWRSRWRSLNRRCPPEPSVRRGRGIPSAPWGPW
ncbi:dihydrofolate reductase family protein [Streptomyces sp. 7N604]|uniref:dihydrofolate reductase family protein n=1 Tax=Streptomyces sp. 7N604 TaxID=3457415 RepID=UPI003FD3E4C9